MLDQRITVNATGTGEKAVVRMVYGDTGRRLIASFEDYTIPDGSTAQITFERPNGTMYYVAGTITGQDVSFPTDQMTTETGYTVATLMIYEPDGRIASFPFYVFVAKSFDGMPPTPEEAISIIILSEKVELLEAAVEALQNKFPIGTIDIQDGAVTPAKLTESYVPTSWWTGSELVSVFDVQGDSGERIAFGHITGNGSFVIAAAGWSSDGRISINENEIEFTVPALTHNGQPLLSGPIGTANIQDGAVTNAKLADGSVSSEKIADDAVTIDKIAEAIRDAVLIRSEANDTLAAFPDGAGGFNAEDVTVDIPNGSPTVTEITLWTNGVNCYDEETELGAIDNNGVDVPNNTRIRSKNYIPIKPSTTYFYKSSTNDTLVFYAADKSFVSIAYRNNTTFNTPATARFMRIAYNSAYGTTYQNDGGINYPSTATAYKAYDGTKRTVTLPVPVSEGSLDLTTGELTVVSPTPGTYHLTPVSVPIKYGQNNIIADVGTSKVQYIANTKLYIDTH